MSNSSYETKPEAHGRSPITKLLILYLSINLNIYSRMTSKVSQCISNFSPITFIFLLRK